jgi:hypothetical protein
MFSDQKIAGASLTAKHAIGDSLFTFCSSIGISLINALIKTEHNLTAKALGVS